ncbi:MAG: ATP-binding protein [Myxococcota bacterium]
MALPKAVISWSTGKDSAYALHVAREAGDLEIVAALTTVTETLERVSVHGTRETLLDRQMDAIDLPCHKVHLPGPCTNEVYEARMEAALGGLKHQGVSHVLFGDLFLEDLREYRKQHLARIGMRGAFPLWMRDTAALSREMVDAGVRATLVCVDPRVLDPSFCGRTYDHALLDDLPSHIDPCGENGEFHTAVVDAPGFARAIPTQSGEVEERDGFVYADLALLPEA